MTNRRALRLLVALLLGATACTAAGAGSLDADARQSALEASAHAPRAFSLSSNRLGPSLAVEGEVEDDYRYRARVSLAGDDLYEEVVIDDRRWLRTLGGAGVAPPLAEFESSPALAPLVSGEWVSDARGAPPEFAESPARSVFGPDVVLDAVRRLDVLERDGAEVNQLRSAAAYDPDSANYLERDDKFRRHADDGQRFDILPAPYDSEAIFGDGVPPDLREALEPYALFTSYWIEAGRLTRVEILFDVDVATVERDVRAIQKAVEGDVPIASAAPIQVPQPYREALTFEYPDPAPAIEAPQSAVRLELPEV